MSWRDDPDYFPLVRRTLEDMRRSGLRGGLPQEEAFALLDENDRLRAELEATKLVASMMTGAAADHAETVLTLRAQVAELQREVGYLRQYGNKDCTAMADAAMRAIPEQGVEHDR